MSSASGEKKKNEKNIVNALAGLKFKIPNAHARRCLSSWDNRCSRF